MVGREDRSERPKFENWIDRQIREAMERGEFDDLPGAGKPLKNLDTSDENWWIRAKLEREGITPPPPVRLQLRKEREEIQKTLADVATEERARAIVEDLNARIRDAQQRPDGVPVFVRTVVVDDVIMEWRRRRA
ncbi:DnaJ family domain-containing protein [Mariniluteicoccus flavus]